MISLTDVGTVTLPVLIAVLSFQVRVISKRLERLESYFDALIEQGLIHGKGKP